MCALALAGMLAGSGLPGIAGGADASENATLEEARAWYRAGRYEEALAAVLDLSRIDPQPEGLEALRREVLDAVLDARAQRLAGETRQTDRRAMLDATERARIPDSFGLERLVRPGPREAIIPDGTVSALLNRPVTLHLRDASLSAIIDALADDTGANIIAESGLGAAERVNIRADRVPVRELLDYIGRELNVRFAFGQDLIWVTSADPADARALLQTRIYRLSSGVPLHGTDWGGDLDALGGMGHVAMLSQKATVLPETRSHLEEILDLFVPEVPGARVHLDRNTHTLFIRNTAENLELIDRIVRALDTTPPQVLIEARFMEVMAADLRELGIEWILGTDLAVTRTRTTQEDGTDVREPRTLIREGEVTRFPPFGEDAAADSRIRPPGPWGVNLTYAGVLTEPQFDVMLRALEATGRSRTLSVPRVTTVNNSPAKLRDGEDLLYFDEFQAQAFALVDADNRRYTVTALIPKGRPEMQELGITLVAVPSVGADLRTISLLLTPTISRLEGFVNYQDESTAPDPDRATIRQVVAKLPIISRREVQTKVVVESGETVVLGGLIDTVTQETRHRVPVLGSLPLLGSLFRRTEQTEQNKNLLIFVTATVLSERGESLRARADAPDRVGAGGMIIEGAPSARPSNADGQGDP